MSFKARISRLAFAVGVAGLISAQVPLSGGTAMADDDYNLGGGSSARVPIEIAVIGLVGYGIFSTFSSGAAAGAAGTAGAGSDAGGAVVPVAGGAGDAPIYDVANGNPDLTTFAKDADAAGVKDNLKDPNSPYTVFAPTNEAFAALPAATMATLSQPANQAMLRQVVSLHIVAGHSYTIADLKALPNATSDAGAPLTSMSGSPLYVHYAADANTLAVSTTPFSASNPGVTVTQTDIKAKNGYLHPIGSVLPVPTDAAAPAAAAGTPAPATP